MPSFLFDFHAHFSFKPSNSSNYKSGEEPDPDHFRERIRKKGEFSGFAHFSDKTVVKSSQLHGDACTESGHRVICNGLYPLERGFIAKLLYKPIATLTGYSIPSLKLLQSQKSSYFKMMEREYDNLIKNSNKTKFAKHGNKYKVVNSYSEILSNLKSKPDDINLINTVEGGHCFTSDIKDSNGAFINVLDCEKKHIRSIINQGSGNKNFKKFISAIVSNINKIKREWKRPPLFVGLSHHYYNHLAGHSPSLTGLVDFLLNQDGATIDFNNQILNYYYVGIQPWGYSILAKLLGRKNTNGSATRRYLIDVKHMSPQARLDFYKYLDHIKKTEPNERIPIVKSHTAVSGRRDLQKTIDNDHKKFNNERTRSKYFYDGIINLFDDEIKRIVDSDGLLGLMIDERRIMGRSLPPESGFTKKKDFNQVAKKSRSALTKIVKCKHNITWLLDKLNNNPGDSEIEKKIQDLNAELKSQERILEESVKKLLPAYLSVVMRQIFHILDITGQKGWDHICIGTDYDGVINPIDTYAVSSDMSTLHSDMTRFWNKMKRDGSTEIKALYSKHLYGKTTKWWIQKLLMLNGMNFLKKYYNDSYLKTGKVPQPGWALTKDEIDVFTKAIA